jgi:hypothetical protein
MVCNLKETAQSIYEPQNYKPGPTTIPGIDPESQTFAYYFTPGSPLLTLYKDLSTSNSRRRFDYLLYLKIELEVVCGQHMFILDIEFLGPSRKQRAPYDLEANPISRHSVGASTGPFTGDCASSKVKLAQKPSQPQRTAGAFSSGQGGTARYTKREAFAHFWY